MVPFGPGREDETVKGRRRSAAYPLWFGYMSHSHTNQTDPASHRHPVISSVLKFPRFGRSTEPYDHVRAETPRVNFEARHREIRVWGREGDCALLDQLAVGVGDGRSRVLVVRGEAGIGKTALLEYLEGVMGDCRVAWTAGVNLRWSSRTRGCISSVAE